MRADSVTERQVRELIQEYGTALAANDVERMLSVFTGDEDMMVIGSNAAEWAVGANQVGELYRRVFPLPQRASLEWSRVEAFRSGTATWFGAEGTFFYGEQRLPYRLSGVLKEQNGVWKLAQYHGSVAQ